ncbi:NAD(P)-dependent dehydrogenase (short-subunit alcohol dehydrogenase family) [Solirubrobacter pauli]|uniref:NAD(P)-dependent dehydrogenase (Short-subunit alcohol dehydrogenase family) n=1 Tax=Solirubrobacter pauli TaxID=166793 RepID=A0A660L0N6_9ACTN|nr:glucose 1-dehydrogenase [Solirubrobacter pauli]RKQ86469.1 NAD(P)-dependent dehydrogenase (short-subunit alcohol dehydrogenase family) [Solirubrobacter pauli]
MSERFAGKVILVTGATSGIGRAVADRVAEEGATVVLAARGHEAGAAAAAELRAAGADAHFIATDVTVESEVAALVRSILDRHGRLDGAFNNVGAATAIAPLAEIEPGAWRAEIALNLDSVFFSLKHQLPVLQAAGRGAIVNNASSAGVTGAAGLGSYSAAKHGVVGLTRSAALEAAPSGVRVNALVTGGVDTPLLRRNMGSTPDEAMRAAKALHPVGRIGEPDEIAAFTAFLLSDEAPFITGAALAIDGGLTAQ